MNDSATALVCILAGFGLGLLLAGLAGGVLDAIIGAIVASGVAWRSARNGRVRDDLL